MGNLLACQCQCDNNDNIDVGEKTEKEDLNRIKEELTNILHEARYHSNRLTNSTIDRLKEKKCKNIFASHYFKDTDDFIFYTKIILIV